MGENRREEAKRIEEEEIEEEEGEGKVVQKSSYSPSPESPRTAVPLITYFYLFPFGLLINEEAKD